MNNSCPFLHLLRIHPLKNSVREYFPPFFLKFQRDQLYRKTIHYNTVHPAPGALCTTGDVTKNQADRRANFGLSDGPIFADFFVKFLPPYRDFEQTKFHIEEEITFPSQTYRIRHN